MSPGAKLERWEPLHRNGVSRGVHFVAGYLFVFALLVPSFLLAADVGAFRLSAAALVVLLVAVLQLRFDPLSGAISSLLLFLTEPAWVLAFALGRSR